MPKSDNHLRWFGEELRIWRQQAEMSQEQLAARIGYSSSQVGHVETARRAPDSTFVDHCDRVLQTGGALTRLWERTRAAAYPAWFRSWFEIEQEAYRLRSWQPLVVPGLLQTYEYAHALFSVESDKSAEEVERLTQARLERQDILSGGDAPIFTALIDEAALLRPVGSAAVMAGQLAALVEAAVRPRLTIQLIPFDTGAHAGLPGPFALATRRGDNGRDSVYSEGPFGGTVTDRDEDVAAANVRFDAIRAVALPAKASVDLLREMEKAWTQMARSGASPGAAVPRAGIASR
ncbi:helix-turn-helix domain-containing protein [Bailinhaonella thermotolerans]|uniref:XRE family transcriptional regulator n=1 Tax=Bailinhaonella thermotolerans TaxID=1070861 RepID=A0A3A4ASV0_9ACTN|nr:helix-turn-helix transcriptional regulator [Bailinhaonella thermotolerans]RJL31659.1 XRE family transcriptional regulator [Bailinhaonella thermotolerans]